MQIYGITGPTGAGKGYFCDLLKNPGIYRIDTDAVYREMTSKPGECMRCIEERFGCDVVNEDGSLNRKALADIVFHDKGKLGVLNDITHPLIEAECNKIIAEKKKEGFFAILLDAPLLYEARLEKICNAVIAVIADEEIRINRITERDGITREQAELRISNQHSNEFYIDRADIIVTNNDGEIETQAAKILDIIIESKGR